MSLNEELNKILKEMWRIDEKKKEEKDLSLVEIEFYNNHLFVIKNYYNEQYLYWHDK